MDLRPVFPLFPTGTDSCFDDGDPAIRRSLEQRPGHPIVVVKFSGWGTLLGILAFFRQLKASFPDNPPVLVTNPENRPMLEHLAPWLDVIDKNVSPRNPFPGFLPLAFSLRRLRPALFIDLQIFTRKTHSALLSRFSGSPVRLGFVSRKKEWRSFGMTHRFFHNRHFPPSIAIGQLCRFLGLPRPEDTKPFLPEIPEGSEAKIRLLLGQPLFRTGKTIVVNPNASGQSGERRWPPEFFTEVIRMLLERHGDIRIALTGTHGERAFVRSIHERISLRHRDRVSNLAGCLTFSELHALLHLSDGYLGNDSGPLHLALATGTPSLGLFGPTHPDLILPSRPFPKALFLYEPHYCSPCLHQSDTPPCGGDNLCMQSLTPASVLHALEHLLWGTGDKQRLRQVWAREDLPHRAARTGTPLALYRQRDER
ncbi:glycosyltransferase family 9 protein [Leptospirillum ferriphilum]|jgi:ADP-heptose:LPS heptosyltransferase|uniref:ADP-heptose--lipooligosaccharide heptosyltransferase II n=2 Tax=Leptospirillum TaxID=179 RepID=A0A094WF09_9BACT|nr:glycosyltransferase family 9 protein [Leptospirillum ferriphilum]EDZ38393.1 MAG: Putative glycosyl transferase, family 9 [Leptospirillum sp. Group II '5-way CG']KGA94227.1 ADP-heptose--lipooligosaccharide heptosyltransferase II [Leptospirillum ferriphilum]